MTPPTHVVNARPSAGTILGGAPFRLLIALLALTGTSPALAQVIDPGFTPTFNDDIRVVAAYPGGRVLVGGDFGTVNGQTRVGLVRLRADGSVDPLFNVQVIPGGVLTLAVQLDGRIVIGGDFDQVNSVARVNVARLNEDGSLDTSFVPAVPDDDIERLAVQSDNKVLIAGRFDNVGGQPRSYVARLLDTGALDTGFNDPQLDGAVQYIAVQGDNRILLGGDFDNVHSDELEGIARLEGNGSLDGSFADPLVGLIDAVTLLDDDRILFTGAFGTVHGQSRPFIARLLASGLLDSSFVDANLRGNVNLRHLHPLINGTTMLAGDWRWGGDLVTYGVGRILADGQRDVGYSAVTFDSLVYGLTVQAGGRIYAGGLFLQANGLPRSHLVAINPTGVAVDELERNGGTLLWRREGIVPMLSAPPQLQLSSDDGSTFVTFATMTEVAEGWSASGIPNTATHARARGLLTANAGLIDVELDLNLVYLDGFETP